MYLQKVISKKAFVDVLRRSLLKLEGSGSRPDPDPLVRGMAADPDPYQNFMDPQHWFKVKHYSMLFEYFKSIQCVCCK
jgi:hypothetical protein